MGKLGMRFSLPPPSNPNSLTYFIDIPVKLLVFKTPSVMENIEGRSVHSGHFLRGLKCIHEVYVPVFGMNLTLTSNQKKKIKKIRFSSRTKAFI